MMRWLVLALPPVVVSICGAIGGGSGVGSPQGSVGAGSMANGGGVVIDCGTPPAGATYLFDSENIDGTNNSTMTNGAFVTTWVNLGSLGATGNATQAGTNTLKPIFLSNAITGKPGLAFDGVGDFLRVGASNANMKSMVAAGKTGHFAAVYRYDGPSGGAATTIFGNSNSSGQPGWAIGNIEASGGVTFMVGPSSSAVNTTGLSSPVRTKQQILQLWADGTNRMYKSSAVAGTSTVSIAGLTVNPGNLPFELAMGCSGAVTTDCSDGVFAWIGYWQTNLSAGDQAQLEAYLTCKYSL